MSNKSLKQLQEGIKQTSSEVNRVKASTVQYHKTAEKKTRAIEKLLLDSSTKANNTLKEFKEHLSKETGSFKVASKQKLSEVDAYRVETRDSYHRFSTTYRTAMNKRSGVKAKHDKIIELSQKATEKTNEISKNENIAKNDVSKIREVLTKARVNKKVIDSVHDESIQIAKEIKDIYALTSDAGLSGTLIERREDLKKRTDKWEKYYLGSITAIVIAIILALSISRPSTFTEVITERLVFVTPLILVSFVLSKQFLHERKLFEEYAFKAAAAQSIRSYTLLLSESFKEHEGAIEKILVFTLGAMSDIYDREPLKQSPSIIHLAFGNNIGKFEAKFEDITERAVTSALEKMTSEAPDTVIGNQIIKTAKVD